MQYLCPKMSFAKEKMCKTNPLLCWKIILCPFSHGPPRGKYIWLVYCDYLQSNKLLLIFIIEPAHRLTRSAFTKLSWFRQEKHVTASKKNQLFPQNIVPVRDTHIYVYAQSCLTLWPHRQCSPPSSVHGISQTRILEWVAIFSSRELNPHLLSLLHWQVDSLPGVPPGKPQGTQTVSNHTNLKSEKIPWVT